VVLSFGTMINTLMGLDMLAGGMSGALMDAVGCVVLIAALGLGLLRGWWPLGYQAGPQARHQHG
jgi:hypothetical protein